MTPDQIPRRVRKAIQDAVLFEFDARGRNVGGQPVGVFGGQFFREPTIDRLFREFLRPALFEPKLVDELQRGLYEQFRVLNALLGERPSIGRLDRTPADT